MNALNILSSRVIGPTTSNSPSRSRSRSQGPALSGSPRSDLAASRSYSEGNLKDINKALQAATQDGDGGGNSNTDAAVLSSDGIDEKSPLLYGNQLNGNAQSISERFFDAIAETIKTILSVLASPALYFDRGFRDEEGRYSFLAPMKKLYQPLPGIKKAPIENRVASDNVDRGMNKPTKNKGRRSRKSRVSLSTGFDNSCHTSDSEADQTLSVEESHSDRRHSRTKPHFNVSGSDESPRRSIRIEIQNDKHPKRANKRRSHDVSRNSEPGTPIAADSLKSPMSPSVHKLTKYPHAPTPPRPLIPPRQPSYLSRPNLSSPPQKTLILDLDETLIHSLSKGGRMSSGHMVEVKLSAPTAATAVPAGIPTTVGPHHPILYYVHKRPHCDAFLRKVCQWYKLVVFTASVQEYADPVIDWLEQERKFFHGRYYRQHCTIRNGAYIKDLSSVEPDLSKVMILDNSPMSYIFHEGKFVLLYNLLDQRQNAKRSSRS